MAVARERSSANRFETWTDWSGYVRFLDAVGDRPVRVTYDRGKLELMTPSAKHESAKKFLAYLLEQLMAVREVDFLPLGSMTFKREDLDRGLEPDECYWIENYSAVGPVGRDREFDARTDPPPDLVIEVEVSRSSIDRLDIYHAMQVPEIWRWTRRGRLEFHVLGDDGTYRVQSRSRSFPWLVAEQMSRFVHLAQSDGPVAAGRALRAWLEQQPD